MIILVIGHVGHGSVHWWIRWVTGQKMWPVVSSAWELTMDHGDLGRLTFKKASTIIFYKIATLGQPLLAPTAMSRSRGGENFWMIISTFHKSTKRPTEIYSRIWMIFFCLFFPMRTKDSSRTTARTHGMRRQKTATSLKKRTTNDSSWIILRFK